MKKILLVIILGLFMISLSSALLNESIVSYWKFDQISGPVLDELNTHNGTAVNSPTRGVTGKINKTFTFDGINQRVDTSFQPDIENRSIGMWYKLVDATPSGVQVSTGYDGTSASTYGSFGSTHLTNGTSCLSQSSSVFCYASSTDWVHIVISQNSTHVNFFLNGALVETNLVTTGVSGDVPGQLRFASSRTPDSYFAGDIDEVGFWNKSLTEEEVTNLYNGGDGLTYPFLPSIQFVIALDSPSDTSTVSGNITFNATITPPSEFSITNATLYIWDSDGDLFYIETNILTGNISNSTSYIVDNITFGNYEWNVLGVVENSTGSVISNFSSSNFSLSWVPFSIDNEQFNTDVFETSRQEFLLNINTLPSVLSVDAILNYNGTLFTATTTCSSGLCQISTAIDIPLVLTGEEENKSFFWEIFIFDGTNSFSTNVSSNDQNVTRLHLEKCDGTFTVQTLNFTSFDEQTESAVDPFMLDGSFEFWMGTGTIKRSNSISESSISSLQMCLTPTTETLFLDGTIEYDEDSGANYTKRNYFFQEDEISNVSQDIKLGLLLAEDSTSFILKVQDRDILPVSDVLIFTQRFYPGQGEFITVQVSQTDDNGATVGFFETETVEYRFILKQNGETVLVTNKQKIVGESVPFTLTFTIGEDEGAAWEPFEEIGNLTSDILFNKTSNIVSFTYLDTSGNFELGRLIVEKVNASGLQNTVICSQTSTQSSATITCNLTGNSTGQYITRGIITRDGTSTLVEQTSFAIEDFSTISGRLGLFLGWFVILIAVFAFKFNEVAGIILVNLAIIFVNLIGLIAFGYVFISAMVAISIIILVVLER